MRKLIKPLSAMTGGLIGYVASKKYYQYQKEKKQLETLEKLPQFQKYTQRPLLKHIKSREEQFEELEKNKEYDLVIIGGGATGAGCALDATTRGLKVCLIERDDFASGTSSRSTKLVHGGVRYLEKAFWQLDYDQLSLVMEALAERRTFLDIAPHLSKQLPILLPMYSYMKIPYFWAGSKAYDILAGDKSLSHSYFLSASKAIEAFPLVRKDGLAGAMVYYDGQHNDARMNVALALTSAAYGATVVNHTEVDSLIKDDTGRICGVTAFDRLSDRRVSIRCKGVINATGPFSDAIRSMDSSRDPPIVVPSAGVHITLPASYAPSNMGLLDPSTSDGRVIFFLPWQGRTIAGTTDKQCDITDSPTPDEESIRFILNELSHQLSVPVPRSDVLSAWSGLRPLVKDISKGASTENLSRHHLVSLSPSSGLLTVAGGKWTTYRQMAEDAVDLAVSSFSLSPSLPLSITRHVKLLGAHLYNPFDSYDSSLPSDISSHLSSTYGDLVPLVLSCDSSKNVRLSPLFPYLESEVLFSCRYEYAETLVDVLARRTRLSFLDSFAALSACDRIASLMASEKGWSSSRLSSELSSAYSFLTTMGLPPCIPSFCSSLSPSTISSAYSSFLSFDPSPSSSSSSTSDFVSTGSLSKDSFISCSRSLGVSNSSLSSFLSSSSSSSSFSFSDLLSLLSQS